MLNGGMGVEDVLDSQFPLVFPGVKKSVYRRV